MPQSIAKLVFTAALDDGGTMRDCDLASMRLGDAVVVTLTGADFASEKAVILGELYRKDGQWHFGAVGQGFDGRLSALLKHFGGLEAPARSPVVTPEGEAGSQKVSLSKITPEKRGDKISLEKRRAQGFGRVYVNLNWHRQPAGEPARKFIGKLLGPSAPRGVDLDLGCQYELSDGRKGVVQALGEAWGSIDNRPYICLDGDDRTGSDEGGENMYVNGDRFDQIRRILVFAFIDHGVANWAETDGVVTVRIPDQPTLEVRLDNGAAQGGCAIAMIENCAGQMQINKLAEYVGGHRELISSMDSACAGRPDRRISVAGTGPRLCRMVGEPMSKLVPPALVLLGKLLGAAIVGQLARVRRAAEIGAAVAKSGMDLQRELSELGE